MQFLIDGLSSTSIFFRRAMLILVFWVVALPIGLFAEERREATHKQAYTLKPTLDGKTLKLETFCLGPRGNVWMACSCREDGEEKESGMMMVYDPSGLLFSYFPLSFVPQAINFSPNSRLYVAGEGKVARVSLDGRIEIEIDAPNIGNREETLAQARQKAEEELAATRSVMEEQKQNIEKQIAKLKEAPDDEEEKAKAKRERRLRVLEQQLKAHSDEISQPNIPSDEEILKNLHRASGIAATDNEVYVACPEAVGYGYGIWRLSPDLTLEDKVISDARGCCGQFDIQTDGTHLILAENTKFEVGIYDRNGKAISSFGKRSSDEQDGFGSCCNPMNVRCDANGDIVTGESSIGHIKRFSRDGRLLSYVGTAKVGGGCKHVAVAFDADRNWYYMMNEDLSHVAVLVLKEEAPEETEDERLSREAMEGLGKKLIGTWEHVPESKREKKGADVDGSFSMSDYVLQQFSHLEFAPDQKLEHRGEGLKGSVVKAKSDSQWNAVRQIEDRLEIITIQAQIPGFGAMVQFEDDETARFDFFYSSPDSKIGSFTFKRTSYDACGQNCSNGKKCSSEKSVDESPSKGGP